MAKNYRMVLCIQNLSNDHCMVRGERVCYININYNVISMHIIGIMPILNSLNS